MFVRAVVIAGNRTGAHVHSFPDFRITEIGEVVGLGALAETNLFGFHKIADVRVFTDFAARAKVRIGTKPCA